MLTCVQPSDKHWIFIKQPCNSESYRMHEEIGLQFSIFPTNLLITRPLSTSKCHVRSRHFKGREMLSQLANYAANIPWRKVYKSNNSRHSWNKDAQGCQVRIRTRETREEKGGVPVQFMMIQCANDMKRVIKRRTNFFHNNCSFWTRFVSMN